MTFPLNYRRIRALLVIIFCLTFAAFGSWWATEQRATVRSNQQARYRVPLAALSPDKGGITPAASTITVNSLSDVANGADGLCTLREAITAGNNNAASGATAGECAAGSSSGSDTIDMTAVTGIINLTGALPNISSSMTITGSGSTQLTVRRDTGGDYRIFSISSSVTVAISGMTITNGKTPDGASGNSGSNATDGGGLLNAGTLTLTDIVSSGNRTGNGGTGSALAGGNGGNGAGVANVSNLTMTNCAVTGNTAGNGGNGASNGGKGGNGGGIFSSGPLTLSNCTITGNQGGNNFISGGFGGGGHGGGVYSTSGPNNFTNVTVSNNFTGNAVGGSSEAGIGGGIYFDNCCSAISTITNSTIDSNHTGTGGGLGYGGGISGYGAITISASTISNNISSGSGGGILFQSGALKIFNTTISGNTGPGGSGVGLSTNSPVYLANSTITGNTGSPGMLGGFGPTITIRNTIIAANDPTSGDVSGNNINSQGHNLIGFASTGGGSSGFTNGVNGDQVGTSSSPINPGLAALANNGGPTKTHALLSNSTALDAGDNCVTDVAHCGDANISQLTSDQRGAGFSRLVDGPDVDTTAVVDIGAYETQTPLANLADASTNEDTQLQVVFDAGDTSTISSVTASSDNTAVVPNDSAHLSVVITGSTGIVTINPATNAVGTTNITVTINRTAGGPDVKILKLTVNPVNDAPSFTKGADQTVNEDTGAQTFNNWATSVSPGGGSDESGQTLTFQVTGNTNTSLFSAGPTISSSGTLSYTPAADANGSATITLNLKDNGGTANGGVDTSASQTFTITVNPVNDAPSFTKGPDQTFNEDSGSHFVSPWATSVLAGPSNEAAQSLTFQVTNNTNPSLFSTAPSVNSAGQLSFSTASNANGSATITIVLKDNGGTANGGVDTSPPQTFTITVNPVNDAPSFTKGPNQTVNNNAGAQTVNNWATNISPGPSDESGQTVAFQIVSNTNSTIFAVAPAVSSTGTLTYTPNPNGGGTATITINLKDNGGIASGGIDTSANQSFTITVNPIGGFISFASSSANTTENSGSTTVTVRRTGDTSRAATVDYATNGDSGLPCSTASGVASPKCDFTAAIGTLNFAPGDINKTITILIGQDSFVEGPEVITLTLANPQAGAALGTPGSMSITIADDVPETTTNIIDDPNLFVRMHYHDFLNREADQSGLDFWTGQMTNCGNSDLTVCRVNVSGAFFLSIEFQQTGYLVERIYKTGYGDATATSTIGGSHQIFVPVIRANEFLTDTQRVGRGVVVNQGDWQTTLENNKQAYALEFVQTSRFVTAFPTTMTPTAFVDKLNTNAGNVLSSSERTTAINLFGNAADTTNVTARAQALRQVAEDADLYKAEFNRAFVLTQFFGYLRRNPNDAPDSDYTGYDFWLGKLNQFNGDYIAAEMVKAFIASDEYRHRFGP
jgi:CSLREA domain-containing protein